MVDLTLVNFEVTNEPKIVHSEAVLDMLDQAAPLLKISHNGDCFGAPWNWSLSSRICFTTWLPRWLCRAGTPSLW